MSGAVTKSVHDFDPLDEVLRPPIDETEQDRVIRQAQEAEARRVSQAIDDSIRAEKQAQKKKGIVRLLLLGQSESGMSDVVNIIYVHSDNGLVGKSTTLRRAYEQLHQAG